MTTNREMLNAMRNEASQAYRSEIPLATSDSAMEVWNTIEGNSDKIKLIAGVFLDKIVKNKFKRTKFTHDLAVLKKGDLPYGTGIEDVFVDIAESKVYTDDYEGDVKAMMERVESKIKTTPIITQYNEPFKATVNDFKLKRAFSSVNGFEQLTESIVLSLVNGAKLKEFKTLKTQLEATTKYIVVPEDPSELAIAIQTITANFKYPSTNYNMLGTEGIQGFCNDSDIRVVIPNSENARMNVKLLAQAYNMSYAEVKQKVLNIDSFSDSNIMGMIIDQYLVQWYDVNYSTDIFRNVGKRYTNFFLFHDAVMGRPQYVNAVKLVKSAPVGVESYHVWDGNNLVLKEVKRSDLTLNYNDISKTDNEFDSSKE